MQNNDCLMHQLFGKDPFAYERHIMRYKMQNANYNISRNNGYLICWNDKIESEYGGYYDYRECDNINEIPIDIDRVGYCMYDVRHKFYDYETFEIFSNLCQQYLNLYNPSFGFNIKDIDLNALKNINMTPNQFYFYFLAYLYCHNIVDNKQIILNAFDQFCYNSNIFTEINSTTLFIKEDIFTSPNFDKELFLIAIAYTQYSETYKRVEIALNTVSKKILDLIVKHQSHTKMALKNGNDITVIDNLDTVHILPNTILILDNYNSF